MPKKAIEMFKNVDSPNEILLCLLFNSCAQVRTPEALDFGRRVWYSASEIHRKDEYNVVAAFDMFIKCGDIYNAEQLFDRMKRITVTYAQMMKCYNDHCMPKKTIALYEKMKNDNVATDVVTFVLLISACAELGLDSRCRSIASEIPSSMLSDVKLQTTLIHMWVRNTLFVYLCTTFLQLQGKVACAKEAKNIFDQIDKPDSAVYTAMSKLNL